MTSLTGYSSVITGNVEALEVHAQTVTGALGELKSGSNTATLSANGLLTLSAGALKVPSVNVEVATASSNALAASLGAGAIVFISDATPASIAISDGTSWKTANVDDLAI